MRAPRIILAIVAAVGAAWLPSGSVMACTCGFASYAEMIAAAEVAFVGSVVSEAEPNELTGPISLATYAFEVERAEEPLLVPYEIDVWFGGDANCGLDMAVGEEWVVVARRHEGRLDVNACTGTARIADLDPPTVARIEAALPQQPKVVSVHTPVLIPGAMLAAAAGVAVIGLLSLLAFQRRGH